jgi:hypothetical protein
LTKVDFSKARAGEERIKVGVKVIHYRGGDGFVRHINQECYGYGFFIDFGLLTAGDEYVKCEKAQD